MFELQNEIRIVVHQTAPLLGELEVNEGEVKETVAKHPGTHLQVFPELALTGYSLRKKVQGMAYSLHDGSPVVFPRSASPVAYGFPERGRDELVYNTAILQHGARILGTHRKVYLPTYGIFDEGRYFARGRQAPPVVTLPSGWRVGLLVCEDFWHPGLLYLAAMQEADIVLVLSAAPGRGETGTERTEKGQGTGFASQDTWILLARTAALQYGVFLVLANRCGVEEGVSFAGGSMVAGPDGALLARAPQGQPATLEASLSRKSLRQARTPFAHLRDEDPDFLRRTLGEILAREEAVP